MNQHCTQCNQPCKPRHDRPGKFFTLCVEHYAEYQRQKNRESYARHKDERVKRAWDWRRDNPETYTASYQRYEKKPEVRERKRAYMILYNSPHRAFIKDACERCGYKTKDPKNKRDLDGHHKDEDHSNNDPANIETLCPPCHRLLE
jgi:hypothetical protein